MLPTSSSPLGTAMPPGVRSVRETPWDWAARRRGSPDRLSHPWKRSEEHTSELQSLTNLVCRLLLEKKKIKRVMAYTESAALTHHIPAPPLVSRYSHPH